ncbi:MAG: hypothetical protein JM58_13835 [Peptococcaceae bacterium BICA1-8]|nr:MAG: hypothetical protein JM58_13835 [Peptococcaceae bacterium BICA1-8]
MKKILGLLDNFEENIISVLLPLMCILVFMATFFRYTELIILPWAEELARYLMIWIVFLGIGTGAKKNRHFAVEVFVKAMPQATHKYFHIFKILVISSFLTFVIYLSINLMKVQIMMGQTSPALNIPMWVAYLAVPVGCGLMVFRTIEHSVKEFKLNGQPTEGKELE